MIIEIITLILSIPVGFLIAYMSRDELIVGRKWFKILFVVSVIIGIGAYLSGSNYISYTGFFISIISLISYIKSYDKKFTSSV